MLPRSQILIIIAKIICSFVYNEMNKIKEKSNHETNPFVRKNYTISRHYRPKSFQLQNEFNKIINLSAKTLDVAQHLKQTFLGIKIDHRNNYVNVKQDKMLMRKDLVNQFQRKNQPFFMPSLQVSYLNKSKDESFPQMSDSVKVIPRRERNMTNPSSPTRQSAFISRIERKSLKAATLPSNLSFQNISKNKKTQGQSIAHKSSIKRSNTFLFNTPTKLKPKKISSKEEQIYKWEDQLHQNLNLIQQTNFKGRQNIKVQREKLSLYLSSIFMNEVITTYYKCETFQNFRSLKLIVEDLINLTQKEHNMITFFTYDVNSDGFICEEDLYFFLQRLPSTSKILQDLYFIVQFLKKNKVRSTEVNLPKKLLKKRQKTTAYMLWSDNFAQKKNPNIQADQKIQPRMINKKFFSLFFKNEQQGQTVKDKPSSKRFQINFDVFNLIFAQKKPVLIQEIIKKFIEKQKPIIKQNMKTEPLKPQSSQLDLLSQTRSQTWKKYVSRSISLVQKAKKEREVLNKKI